MAIRDMVGLVLSVLTLPLLVAGLIDPMEGGVALLAAAVLIALTWTVSRVPVPRAEWVGWIVAMAVGVAAIALAVTVDEGPAPGAPGGLPVWLWVMVAAYDAAVLTAIVGGGQYIARHVRAWRRDHVRLA